MSAKWIQAQPFKLSGSGASIGDTTIILQSMVGIDASTITTSDIGSFGEGTLEPGNGSQEEAIQFTGITQNANGTATLTGVSTCLFKSPYTAMSGLAKTHAGASTFILTNTARFYNQFPAKDNDEAITGNWTVPTGTPVASGGIASKAFVLSIVTGGTVTTDQVVVGGTAGENITAGNVVYLKNDGKWWKASSASSGTSLNVQLGIAQTTSSAAASCNVLVDGTDKTQSSLSGGSTYYLNTAGAVSATAGTISVDVGEAISSSNLAFKPFFSTGVNAANSSSLGIAPPSGVVSPFAGRSAPTGWLLCDGTAVSRTTYATLFATIAPSGTFTVTLASPAVFSKTAHGLIAGDKVSFTTTGALPTGLAANTDYFVISGGLTADAFEVSTSRGGSAVNTSGSQSGVHTVYATNHGKGDGSTTFNVPDFRGFTPYGQKTSDANFDVINTPTTYVGEKTHVLTVAELASHTHTLAGGSTAFTGPTFKGAGDSSFTETSSSTGSDSAHNNMSPYLVVPFIIKT